MKMRTRTTKTASGETHREPRSVVDYDKAMGLIFCPSCRGSQEQLQWQGSIRSAAPLLRSPSRSIINDTEKQGRSCRARCPAHAGASGGGRWVRHTLRGTVRERGGEGDMLLAALIHQFRLKGTRDNGEGKTITHAHAHTHTHTHTHKHTHTQLVVSLRRYLYRLSLIPWGFTLTLAICVMPHHLT